jgi:hypothetical protein
VIEELSEDHGAAFAGSIYDSTNKARWIIELLEHLRERLAIGFEDRLKAAADAAEHGSLGELGIDRADAGLDGMEQRVDLGAGEAPRLEPAIGEETATNAERRNLAALQRFTLRMPASA